MFEISLLGTVEIKNSASLLPPLPTQKATSLISYLILHAGQSFSRENLAELLWPCCTSDKNKQNLYTAVWQIRKFFRQNGLNPNEYLITSGRSVCWSAEASFWLDVQAFEKAISINNPTRYEYAVSLYRGCFMEDFYDDWCLEERCRLENMYLEALRRLARLYYDSQQYFKALAVAKRIINVEPLYEEAVCIVLLSQYHSGSRLMAVDFYQNWAAQIKTELGIEPSTETKMVYQQVCDNLILKTSLPLSTPFLNPGF